MKLRGCPSWYASHCSPGLFTPELAEEIGITRAIILKQIQFWLYKTHKNHAKLISSCRDSKGRVIKKHYWVRDSYNTLRKQIKYIHLRTLERNLKWLKDHDFIFVVRKMSTEKSLGVNLYTINYRKINSVFAKSKYTPNIRESHTQKAMPNSKDTQTVIVNMQRKIQELQKKLSESHRSQISEPRYDKMSKTGDTLSTPSDKMPRGSSAKRRGGIGKTPTPRSDKMPKPSSMRNETNTETNYVPQRTEKSQISEHQMQGPYTDKAYVKVERSFTSTLGSDLTARSENRIHAWLGTWDADLIIIALNIAITNVLGTRQPPILGYAYQVLLSCKSHGIFTGRQWHKAKRKKLEKKQAKYRAKYQSSDGGTPEDMKNVTLYQNMCKVVAGVRTGDFIFPNVIPEDKPKAQLVTKACKILMKTRGIGTEDIQFKELAVNNCARAKQIVESGSAENV